MHPRVEAFLARMRVKPVCNLCPTRLGSRKRRQACTIRPMSGLFDGTPLERLVTCEVCEQPLAQCACPRSESGEVLLPEDQPARVGREKRRKGKNVTVITGVNPVASNLNAILAHLKSACAAGGTINGRRIEIQGDHRERVLSILQDLGYPAKLCGGYGTGPAVEITSSTCDPTRSGSLAASASVSSSQAGFART